MGKPLLSFFSGVPVDNVEIKGARLEKERKCDDILITAMASLSGLPAGGASAEAPVIVRCLGIYTDDQ